MTTAPSENAVHTDRQELKELICEFTHRYHFLHEKRIHKLLFYGEIYTLQNHQSRLSNANFKRYDYGPYASLIRDCITELVDEGRLATSSPNNKTVYHSRHHGNLSQQKRTIIDRIHSETSTMETEHLVQFAKQTSLWTSKNYNDTIDFEAYLETAVLNEDTRSKLETQPRNPAPDSRVEAILS